MKNKTKIGKINIPFCLAMFLFCLTLISIHITGGLYAKYAVSAVNNDDARVAAMKFDVALSAEKKSEEIIITDIPTAPGESVLLNLNLTNFEENGKICEVALNYSVSIENIENNIPLEWEMYTDSELTANAEKMEGIFDASIKESDSYWINIIWPETANDAAYAFEIDAIRLSIDAEQID